MPKDGNELRIGERWAALLRRLYPGPFADKTIARAFDVDPRTARGWLAGQEPHAKHIHRAARDHGFGVLAAIFAPGSDWERNARIGAMLDDLDGKLASLGDELAVLRRID